MNITIIGTSNSIMLGNYVDALKNAGHKVNNLSVGKVSICHHIATFLRKFEEIKQSTCIILDFSPNLSNWVGKEGACLFKHVYNFYALISTLNIPIIDINFPSKNQVRPGLTSTMAKFIRKLDRKFGFISIDLMKEDIPEYFWKDKNHLTAHTSYAIGQILSYTLSRTNLPTPTGGCLLHCPYSIIDTEELANGDESKIITYNSRRVHEKYIIISKPFIFSSPSLNNKRAIAIGTYIPQDTEGGICINDSFKSSCQVKIHSGSLLSDNILIKNKQIKIEPLKGTHSLSFYGSKTIESINCSGSIGLSYLLVYDTVECHVKYVPAKYNVSTCIEEEFRKYIKDFFTPLLQEKSKGKLIEKGDSYSTLPFKTHPAGIRISGYGNVLIISHTADISKMKIWITGNNNVIIIDDNCKLAGKMIINGHQGEIYIGKNTVAIDLYILCTSNNKVHIGKYCLISRLVEIRTSDAHSLIDLNTLKRINKNGDVYIGNHVWLCLRSIVNKNVTIADDVIIGCSSFVNKDILESHVAVAGIPAAIIKKNVSWSRKQCDSFAYDELFFWQEYI